MKEGTASTVPYSKLLKVKVVPLPSAYSFDIMTYQM